LVIESLHLTGNRFNGEIPDMFSELDLLTECRLGQNEFNGGIPVSLGESLALVELALEGNTLTGDVPDEICALMEVGSLEALTSDCYTKVNNSKGDFDPSHIEGAPDGVICECCTECF